MGGPGDCKRRCWRWPNAAARLKAAGQLCGHLTGRAQDISPSELFRLSARRRKSIIMIEGLQTCSGMTFVCTKTYEARHESFPKS